ncbi:hypothetical protein [Hydrogenophaga sp. 5NK40-0174]|uniref:hypothetical protein n=1 Tax=Hydrogenophaga sp. 5NK40-0174 TaxID=3127649 RepID=UPI00310BC5D0
MVARPLNEIRTHWSRTVALLAVSAAALGLAGCYIVPIEPHAGHHEVHGPHGAIASAQPVSPAPLRFTARLYPANEAARAHGVVEALVSNDHQGRGSFFATIGGESFTGEATRTAGKMHEGTANGAGNRGSYLRCRYQMNSQTLGSGTCELSDGSVFNMHVGN